MSSQETLKQELFREIEKLPEYRLQTVLSFVHFLLAQQKSEGEPDSHQDPILEFIGGVSHGTLAQDIDEELYGR